MGGSNSPTMGLPKHQPGNSDCPVSQSVSVCLSLSLSLKLDGLLRMALSTLDPAGSRVLVMRKAD